jgi:hypothetical protein
MCDEEARFRLPTERGENRVNAFGQEMRQRSLGIHFRSQMICRGG